MQCHLPEWRESFTCSLTTPVPGVSVTFDLSSSSVRLVTSDLLLAAWLSSSLSLTLRPEPPFLVFNPWVVATGAPKMAASWAAWIWASLLACKINWDLLPVLQIKELCLPLSTCKAIRVQNGTKAPKTATTTSDHTMPYPGNSGTFPKNQCAQMGTQERELSSLHTFSEVLLWEIFRRRK